MSLNSHFHQLARTITVSDICTPILTTFESNRSVSEVFVEWGVDLCGEKDLDPMDQICLVTKNNKVIGWIGYHSLEFGKIIDECTEPITPESILSSDTSLYDAVNTFANGSEDFYFVLQGNQFIGWLSYKDLYKSPMRLCLFSMLINVEKLLLEVLVKNAQESINHLSKGRIDKAKDIYKWRGYNLKDKDGFYNSLLLECTALIDKFSIAKKTKCLRQKLTTLDNDHLCDLAETLRNEVAHPVIEEHDSALLAKEELWPFIQWVDNLELQLKNYLLENSSKLVMN